MVKASVLGVALHSQFGNSQPQSLNLFYKFDRAALHLYMTSLYARLMGNKTYSSSGVCLIIRLGVGILSRCRSFGHSYDVEPRWWS